MTRRNLWTRTALTLAMTLCGAVAHAATVLVTVLARDGQPLPDAVVRLEPAGGAAPVAPPPIGITIAQEKMQFQPQVSLVPLGSTITFSNLDAWDHHVRGGPSGLVQAGATSKTGFELRLAGRDDGKPPASASVVMTQTGAMPLGCHIHGSMRGFVYVTDSPWVAKTGADGVALLQNVPEGAAHLRVWHPEQLVEGASAPVSVTPATALRLPTQVQPRPRRK
jgi:plastocyanin